MFKRIASALLCTIYLFLSLSAGAQQKLQDAPVQMAEGMRSNGKIYVVVAVLITIMAGILLYLVRLDRKISRLEKQ